MGARGYVSLANSSDVPATLAGLYLCQGKRCSALPGVEVAPGGTVRVATYSGEGLSEVVARNATFGALHPGDGEVALSNSRLPTEDSLLSYVQWGKAQHTLSPLAVKAGLWLEGSYAPGDRKAVRLYRTEGGIWAVRTGSPRARGSSLAIDEVGVGARGYVSLTNNSADVPAKLAGLYLCQGERCSELPSVDVAPGHTVRVAAYSGEGLSDVVARNAEFGNLHPADGEIALSASRRVTARSLLAYVQWGTTQHGLTPVAVKAGLWLEGSSAPGDPKAVRLYRTEGGPWVSQTASTPAPASFLAIEEVGVGARGYVSLTNNSGDAPASLEGLYLCQGESCSALPSVEVAPGGTVRVAAYSGKGLSRVVARNAEFGRLRPGDGEIALTASRRVTASSLLAYVQWGRARHELTPAAVKAGLWLRGSYVPSDAKATRVFRSRSGAWAFGTAATATKTQVSPGLPRSFAINEIGVGARGYVSLTNFTDVPASLRGLYLCQGKQCSALPRMKVAPGRTVRIAGYSAKGLGKVVARNARYGVLRPGGGEVALSSSPRVTARTLLAYVQWGKARHALTPLAVKAGLWVRGSYAPSDARAVRVYRTKSGSWAFR